MHNPISHSRHALSTMACSLTILLVAAVSLQAQGQSAAPASPVAPITVPEKLTEKLTLPQILKLNEIAALRAGMGGGVSERLQGVIPGTDPEQQFHDSLKDLAIKEEMAKPPLLPPSRPSCPDLSNMAEREAAQAVLRTSAKKLEGLAADLEQVQFYDKADELRETAAKYWLQARSLN